MLIVDDNASTREMLGISLERAGHEILGEAEDGQSALKAFSELSPDVAFLDIIILGISGVVVLEEMLNINPAAKVVILTAVDHDNITMELKSKGAAAIVFKPFSQEDLRKVFGG